MARLGLGALLFAALGSEALGLPSAAPLPAAGRPDAPLPSSGQPPLSRLYSDAALLRASSAPLHAFYMYRAESAEGYPPLNVNAANLPGVLWYLHHEVVVQYPRKFRISKIVRFKVQTRAPEPLYKLGMNFGPRGAFDRGQMTGPFVCGRNTTGPNPGPKFCNGTFEQEHQASALSGELYGGPFEWSRYGYFVGCNKLGEWPYPVFEVAYPTATWYSLPGPCPSTTFDAHSASCRTREPGGFCTGTPTGASDCTWTYEMMGEVSVDELVGKSVDRLDSEGGREYDPFTDKGIRFSWWDGINNQALNVQRIEAMRALFARKYPNQTRDEDMPSPPCDFNEREFYKEFFSRDPHSGRCQGATPGDECYRKVMWGMRDGIHGHPDWYPTLTPASGFQDFQRLLFVQGQCPYRPCDEGEQEAPPEKQDAHGGNATSVNVTSVCINAKAGDECYRTVVFAMQDGIYAHPEWYPNLAPGSSFRDFQGALYASGFPECPYRPCEAGEEQGRAEGGQGVALNGTAGGQGGTSTSNATTGSNSSSTTWPADGPKNPGGEVGRPSRSCVSARPGDECYKAVTFAMRDGIYAHPEWYPKLTPSSGFKEFQRAIFAGGSPSCPHRPCDEEEVVRKGEEGKPAEGNRKEGKAGPQGATVAAEATKPETNEKGGQSRAHGQAKGQQEADTSGEAQEYDAREVWP